MIVKVNCPIAGCGTQVQVQSLPKHFENVHQLDGELVLRLHPTAAYQHTPAEREEPEREEPKKEEPGKEPEPGKQEPGEDKD